MAKTPREIDALTHDAARRINVPTAEMASLFEQQQEILGGDDREIVIARPRPLANGEERDRNPDLDPQIVWNGARIRITKEQMRQLAETGELELGDAQLVWRGKDRQDWSDLVVNAPPIYVQEKVHPKAIIDDLKRRSDARREAETDAPDLFADFNGITDPEARAEFYQHAQHWTNRFILGDSLQVMASLAEREAMRGKVQCIYFDPPYGIKFNSNWQVSTQSRDVKDGKREDISREPEQVKAFRDTWKDGIHSYLTYLRDRLMVARELLSESGSIFVQISDENCHRVRALLDEVFGESNYVNTIAFKKKSATIVTETVFDEILWYCKSSSSIKVRTIYEARRNPEGETKFNSMLLPGGIIRNLTKSSDDEIDALMSAGGKWARVNYPIVSQHPSKTRSEDYQYRGHAKSCGANKQWRFSIETGLPRLEKSGRLFDGGGESLGGVALWEDWNQVALPNIWSDVHGEKYPTYIVQTATLPIERCILMTSDPGDLVLDPTCGSGTTATVAEQWGRRWITIDTSRVALALARTRLMAAKFPYYYLADSKDGRDKEQKESGKIQPQGPTSGDIRQGFVYERAPRIALKSIANNAEIDVIWERWQEVLEPLRDDLNRILGRNQPWEDWEIPREAGNPWKNEAVALHTKLREAIAEDDLGKKPEKALIKLNTTLGREYTFETLPAKPLDPWANAEAVRIHSQWWEGRIARQKEIDASIARAADVEMLYDRPYEDKSKVRVAGPFTIESLSPHRVVTARDDTLGAEIKAGEGAMQPAPASVPEIDFGQMVLDHLKSAGVHQQAKADTIRFNSVEPWPGNWLAAKGIYSDGDGREKQAGILIGPEFGTLTRSQITAAAREASEARFDALIACAFNFEAQASDINRLGPLPILKARMNPDLHMADELKNTGKGNLFVVFGEPDVDLIETANGELQVKVNGVDIFDPTTGEIRSDDVKGIAAWFIDTDYNAESFFVRHAYFLGANDPYRSLKTALKAEIDEDAWQTLYSDTSRSFPRPATGRIAVKVINHFGDEVLKVFGV
ncbi:site-specific DNA-methyltransferase [Mesorhizobium sp. WSM3860]|uniref:site-specific DNA-methyltransferase n=1 Tax=Mesorhizobium sp. WSM3860 TaxID=2029403 RepID=UPI000BB0A408|nr:site-specific DNA-methyltransferase [Mesorhizobium sp. WSM3860]PBC01454.1 site-specific DNA-methyltransferase [Mesorhizobium sp. WSM3860]